MQPADAHSRWADRLGRDPSKSRRHPFLQGRPKGVFYPDAVGIVPGYPKTAELHAERGKRSGERFAKARAEGKIISRAGVPNGWGGRPHQARGLRALAKQEAGRIFNYLQKEGLLMEPHNEIANQALRDGIEMYMDPTFSGSARAAIHRTILEYTMAKPASKSEIQVKRAEDWLDEISHKALERS